MTLVFKISSFVLLVTWALYLIIQVPEFTNAGPNSNISVCFFCDTEVDFSVRNLICCSLTSRCCGPDRI